MPTARRRCDGGGGRAGPPVADSRAAIAASTARTRRSIERVSSQRRTARPSSEFLPAAAYHRGLERLVAPRRAAAGARAAHEHAVLVVDFGAQYAQLIARRVRELSVFSEIVPNRITAAEVAARRPAALILSGGPKSVHVDGAPSLDPAIYDLGVPVLGICYGAQLIAQQLGGTVGRGMRGEYGRAKLRRTGPSLLFPDDAPEVHDVWMSHFDAITVAPGRLHGDGRDRRRARSPCSRTTPGKIYGVQFHPEVVHSPYGMGVLRRFLHERAGCPPTWTMSSVIDEQVARIRAEVGDGRVICALSGGVDSSVAAALVHRAVGPQLTCIYVDTGLMRKGESAQVTDTFRREMGIELIHVDAADRFFARLDGRHRPGDQAQGHRRRVHPRLRGAHRRARRGRVPRPGHALPGPHRVRRHRRHGGGHQEPPQRRRAARGHAPDAHRAVARAVQGRGAPPRARARPARRDGLAPAVPRARAWPCGSSAR